MANYTRNRKFGCKNLPQQSHQRQVSLGIFRTKLQKKKKQIKFVWQWKITPNSYLHSLEHCSWKPRSRHQNHHDKFFFPSLSVPSPFFSLHLSHSEGTKIFERETSRAFCCNSCITPVSDTEKGWLYPLWSKPKNLWTPQESLEEGKAQVSQFYAMIYSKVATETVTLLMYWIANE